MTLAAIWFILIFVLLTGYAILDGFDLGVGALHLFARDDHERRIHLNAIGPVWDGNEVWLLTGGGALFAAFPAVYATVFSGFYLALMLLLVALIARAIAMEFRGKVQSPGWKTTWDWAFSLGSILPAVLLGVAFGNILRGLPIDEHGDFTGNFFTLLNPFSVLVGVLSLVLFLLHGTLYLVLKSEGDLQSRLRKRVPVFYGLFLALYVLASALGPWVAPSLYAGLFGNTLFWLLLMLTAISIIYLPVAAAARNDLHAFVASSAMIAGMIGISAVSLFPKLVPSTLDPNFSLTIANSSSTRGTLLAMLVIALIGMPLVIGYTAIIYRIFKGKVTLGEESY